MSAASSARPAAPLDDAALIEISRANASTHLARRDWTGAFGQTIAFFVVAASALAVPSHRQISLVAVLVTVACYALASRVRFEYGGVFAVPTEPVFIAMWFLVPPRLLPFAICAGLLLSELPEIVTGKTPVDRLVNWVAASWFSVGPALVIYLWASHEPRWSDAPVYAGALGAQLLFDFTSTFLIARPAVGVGIVEHFRSMKASMTVDVLLAPLGLLVAFVVSDRPLTLLLVLPTLLLFATFARERQHRIDHALELSTAY